MAASYKLTNGRAKSLIRLLSLSSLLFFAAGGLLFFAPVEEITNTPLAVASTPDHSLVPLQFTHFNDLLGTRTSLFEFGKMEKMSVKWREVNIPEETETAEPEKQPIPEETRKPAPDVSGLELVGTMPGTNKNFAVIIDGTNQTTHTVTLGQKFRQSTIEKINVASIVLKRDDQYAELTLPELSENDSISKANSSTAKQPAQNTSVKIRNAGSERKTASLGMRGYMLQQTELEGYQLDAPALMVTFVKDINSPVKKGDVILSVDGKVFSSIKELISIIQKKYPGDSVSVGIKRNGVNENIDITLG